MSRIKLPWIFVLGFLMGIMLIVSAEIYAYVKHPGKANIFVTCVEGYKYVIAETSNGVAITQASGFKGCKE